MGSWYSSLVDAGEMEMVSRCKARKRYMKQFVKARDSFSAAHSLYLTSLHSTGAALLQFAAAENNLHHRTPLPGHPKSPRSPNPASRSTTSSVVHPPPSTWDFWDPSMPTNGRPAHEECEETAVDSEDSATTTAAGDPSVADPPSLVTTPAPADSDLAVVASGKRKDLVEIIQELNDYFLQGADAGGELSLLLEIPTSKSSQQAISGPLSPWGSSSSLIKWNAFGKVCKDAVSNNVLSGNNGGGATHRSTVERLYAWEMKLCQEVKNVESLKVEHEKKRVAFRNLEMKNADCVKAEKARKEAEKSESQMLVASQAIETISSEIVKLRDSELYPQLLELVKGLMNMWRSMYELHQVQTLVVEQLKYLNTISSLNPTSEIHRHSTLQLELESQKWHLSFCNLIKAQRDYTQSLSGWLRLSLFQARNHPLHTAGQGSAIYSLCEEWQLAINNAPDKVASEGIKSFLTLIRAIVVQQTEERKQRRKFDLAFKELEKKAIELRCLENKYGLYSVPVALNETGKNPVEEKRTKLETLRGKAEDEKGKYQESISLSRAMTINNLQMGLPHLFRAMTGFANVSAEGFESVHNRAKSGDILQCEDDLALKNEVTADKVTGS